MQSLLTEAQRLNVRVVYAPLEPPRRGFYSAMHEVIVLAEGLTLPQRREAFAHELGHAYYGHECSNRITEAQAWKRAAQLTVNPEEYARAERINPHPAAIAIELELTTRLVIEWQTHIGSHYERKLTA